MLTLVDVCVRGSFAHRHASCVSLTTLRHLNAHHTWQIKFHTNAGAEEEQNVEYSRRFLHRFKFDLGQLHNFKECAVSKGSDGQFDWMLQYFYCVFILSRYWQRRRCLHAGIFVQMNWMLHATMTDVPLSRPRVVCSQLQCQGNAFDSYADVTPVPILLFARPKLRWKRSLKNW